VSKESPILANERLEPVNKQIENIARKDGRYSPSALNFVFEGLNFTVGELARQRGHVSGQMLCEGLRQLALKKWGRLAALVLAHWGIKTTRDFGQIVFLMVQHALMSAQPTDSIDDFNNVYDFETVFKKQFRF